MSASQDRYQLLWKGRESGPFDTDQIQEKLFSGEISRIHQINANGRWQLLDEFLERMRQAEMETERAQEQRRREEEQARNFEMQLAEERARNARLLERQTPAPMPDPETRSPLSHLLPRESASGPPPSPPPPFTPTLTAPPGGPAAPFESPGFSLPPPFPETASRTSGLAVAALVMGLCNFIPFVNFVSWILALIFGHVALAQIKRDDSLKGRGLAITGLCITYFLLIMGTVYIALSVSHYGRVRMPY